MAGAQNDLEAPLLANEGLADARTRSVMGLGAAAESSLTAIPNSLEGARLANVISSPRSFTPTHTVTPSPAPASFAAPTAFSGSWSAFFDKRTQCFERQMVAIAIMALVTAAAAIGQQMIVTKGTDQETQGLYGLSMFLLAPLAPLILPTLDTILGRTLARSIKSSAYYDKRLENSELTEIVTLEINQEVGAVYQATLLLGLILTALNVPYFVLMRNLLESPLLNLGLSDTETTKIMNTLPWLTASAVIGTKVQADLILFCQTQLYRRAQLLNLCAQVAFVLATFAFLTMGLEGLAIAMFAAQLLSALVAIPLQLSSAQIRKYELFSWRPTAVLASLTRYGEFSATPLITSITLSNAAGIYSTLQGTVNLQMVVNILTAMSSALAQIAVQVKGADIEQNTGKVRNAAILQVLALSTIPGLIILGASLFLADYLKILGGANTEDLSTANVRVNTALGLGSQIASILASILTLIFVDKGNVRVPSFIIGLSALVMGVMSYFKPINLGDDYQNTQGNMANLVGSGFALLCFLAYAGYKAYMPAASAVSTPAGSSTPVAAEPENASSAAPAHQGTNTTHVALTMYGAAAPVASAVTAQSNPR